MPTVTVDIVSSIAIQATAKADVLGRAGDLSSLQATSRERVEFGGSGETARFPIEFGRLVAPVTIRSYIDLYGYQVLTLLPDRTNYAVSDAAENIAKPVDGGLSRSRRDLSGSTVLIDAVWTLKGSDYDTLATFYLALINGKDQTFKIDLIVDQPELTTHLAKFMPGTFALNGHSGDTFSVQAQLEVTPLTPNTEYDASFVAIYGTQLANRNLFLSALATFANATLDTYF